MFRRNYQIGLFGIGTGLQQGDNKVDEEHWCRL